MFCGMVDGLAFLPKDSINLEMDCLGEIVPFELTELLDYFYETYVSGPCRIIPKAENSTKMFKRYWRYTICVKEMANIFCNRDIYYEIHQLYNLYFIKNIYSKYCYFLCRDYQIVIWVKLL